MTFLAFAAGTTSITRDNDTSAGSTNTTYMRDYSAESIEAFQDTQRLYRLEFSDQTEFWSSAWCYQVYGLSANLLLFQYSTGSALLLSSDTSNYLYLKIWDGVAWNTLATSASPVPPPTNPQFRVDTKIKYDAVNGEFSVYIDGSLFVQFLGDTIGNRPYTVLNQIVYLGANWGSARYTYWSEMMVATHDLRTFTANQHVINGDGAHTDMTGSYTEVDNLGNIDDLTLITTNAADQVSSFTHTASHPDFSGQYPVAVGVFTRARTSVGSSITNMQLMISDGVNDSFSEDISLLTDYDPYRKIFYVHPAGVDWSIANINALQVGVKSRS